MDSLVVKCVTLRFSGRQAVLYQPLMRVRALRDSTPGLEVTAKRTAKRPPARAKDKPERVCKGQISFSKPVRRVRDVKFEKAKL